MELRKVIVLLASVLAQVLGEKQCEDHRKCVPFNDCLEYQSYFGKSTKTWPLDVRNEVQVLFCGIDQGTKGTIYKFCCKPNPVIMEKENPKPLGRGLLDLENCGKQTTDRVAHGEIAKVFEYPWMALLGGINGNFHCGGSLVAESYVLTAAHCNKEKVFFVRVGETDLSTPIDCKNLQSVEDCAEPFQDIPVARFIRHQNYSASRKKNDIALIKLIKPALLNHNVRPICLPLPEMLPMVLPHNMTVSGWGHTEDRNEISNELRFASIPILKQDKCQNAIRQLHDVYTLDDSQVCAGNDNSLRDNCKGDSGGPLQYFGNKGYVIHGVVSWGLASCGKESAPGVYTKISHYLTWIIDNLK